MQRRITHHEPDLAEARVDHALDDRIEGPAGLAGRIQELDDRHLGRRIAEDRRMRPDQRIAVGLSRLLHFLVRAAREDHDTGHEGQNHRRDGAQHDPFPAHVLALPLAIHNATRIPVNAASDNNGIGTTPATWTSASAQDDPLPHGTSPSDTTPQKTSRW